MMIAYPTLLQSAIVLANRGIVLIKRSVKADSVFEHLAFRMLTLPDIDADVLNYAKCGRVS